MKHSYHLGCVLLVAVLCQGVQVTGCVLPSSSPGVSGQQAAAAGHPREFWASQEEQGKWRLMLPATDAPPADRQANVHPQDAEHLNLSICPLHCIVSLSEG
jgi:hypothetical protein